MILSTLSIRLSWIFIQGIKLLMNFLFPIECLGCWKPWTHLCAQCLHQCYGHAELCPLCHTPSPWYICCIKCNYEINVWYHGIIVGFIYQDLIKRAIIQLKYHHKRQLSEILWDKVALLAQTHPLLWWLIIWSPSSIALSYIPSHRTRKYFQKGYNQSELLAQIVGKKLWITIIQPIKKTRMTRRQTGLDRKRRLSNLIDAFSPLWGHNQTINDSIKHIIIVDDIVTTWSSINHVAKAIKSVYPTITIWWLVVARNG